MKKLLSKLIKNMVNLQFTGFAILLASSFLFIPGCRESDDNEEDDDSSEISNLLGNTLLRNLGEKLFFDKNLSVPAGQSCADCHGPEVGWTGPDEQVNKTGGVYPGADHSRFGNRKPNSSAYATYSPPFHSFSEDGEIKFAGGNFWDGRATGLKLGNPAADQAQGPFLNPVEQNIPDAGALTDMVCKSGYAELFRQAGKEIWNIPDILSSGDVNLKYGIIGIAIAAYESSEKVNQFSSKFDYYLSGKAKLSDIEMKGFQLFRGKGKCSNCHTIDSDEEGAPPLFTDFTFDNLGIPANPENPWYKMDTTFNRDGAQWNDPGLAGFITEIPQYAMHTEKNLGKHQVPTLRNVDKRPSVEFVKCFGHNGYFKSLREIVHFYNTRDVLPPASKVTDPKPGINCWPDPEIKQNMNITELGNLGLTDLEELAIVAFMKTLSDGYTPE